ncbi:cupin domain-containing protein [Amycolatopsis alkalitolerans]|uniref:Cupin domain-containing protein n=1 Tax=Amycolatopsis alkalitolerans TaxID=2547244 RepID=A0A5C4MBM3_9PSEU|nr:hypothetical protein [Amycolatopsis alkalitolerans]TNC29512.1 hypothetical protein FG385_00615 [Amycolatopsis alkalitolerans]
MYTTDDPRAALGGSGVASGIAAPEYHDFSGSGRRTEITRAQNVVLAYTRPSAGESLGKGEFRFEHVLLLVHHSSAAEVVAGDGKVSLRGQGMIVIPPGISEIVSLGEGDLVRLIQPDEADWASRARNAASYAEPHPRVTPLTPWPAPAEDRLRFYPLADVPEDPKRFGRIFRTRAFMVNFLAPQEGPRDPSKLSPHHHDDFEQISLAVEGEYVHHIRTPWTTDSRAWREDDHERAGSPSVTVIPPPTVHTSAAIAAGRNQLIDIFSPPRKDFSAQPGWVLNEEEYPEDVR